VHIALAADGGTRERGLHFAPGDRERIRWQAAQTALDMVRRHFIGAGEPQRPGRGTGTLGGAPGNTRRKG
jgi:hypothetical protein